MGIFTKRPAAGDEPVRAIDSEPAAGTPLPPADPALEKAVLRVGTEYLDRARGKRSGLLSAAFWSDKLMDWAMKDEAFKVQLFRFVDVLPRLGTPEQVHDHLVDYLTQPDVTLPPGLGVGLKVGGFVKGAATKTVVGRIEARSTRPTGGAKKRELRGV